MFRHALDKAKHILCLADNAGETVFDRLLIEEIKRLDTAKKLIYAVREKPIINDALVADALKCGINKVGGTLGSRISLKINKEVLKQIFGIILWLLAIQISIQLFF